VKSLLRKPFSLPRPERREAEVRKGEGSKVGIFFVRVCGRTADVAGVPGADEVKLVGLQLLVLLPALARASRHLRDKQKTRVDLFSEWNG
jgi:hypothetical protein